MTLASRNTQMINTLPIFAICGWGNSGKSTLIEKLILEYTRKGLRVVAVKHNMHHLDLDHPGKDSDRFFQAGADVHMQSQTERLQRSHPPSFKDLDSQLIGLSRHYDLILVEGQKKSPLPKVWLQSDNDPECPDDITNVKAVISRDEDRLVPAMKIIDNLLADRCAKAPVSGCVLIGGKSRRMATPKHLLKSNGKTWIEHAVETLEGHCDQVIILGAGELPESLGKHIQLPDAPNVKGPMAGILSAMRWSPASSWLVAACDMPNITPEAIKWLLGLRKPGIWTVFPKLQGSCGLEPLLAYYDMRCHQLLENLAFNNSYKITCIESHDSVHKVMIPEALELAWSNINPPDDLSSMRGDTKSR